MDARAVRAAWALSLLVHIAGVVGGYWLALGLGLPSPDPVAFAVAWFVANFICSFAPIAAIGIGQIAYAPIFDTIAHIQAGATLATALQLACLLIKFPGLFAWLMTRESGKPPSAVMAGKDVT